ncbi:hypothetical protein GGR54DRAFT_636925 [Hypoxylon sp. NC1633]|nr:hypothetical protein GGR54DRAFT_636925 [Hypoxylon sp. NC1633]
MSEFGSDDQVDYLRSGKDLSKLNDFSGISAATALAVGLAVLTLWYYAHKRGPDWEKKFRVASWERMDRTFLYENGEQPGRRYKALEDEDRRSECGRGSEQMQGLAEGVKYRNIASLE